ncbi:metal ABC transporter substrate-binding protein [Methanospirillum purgamenti]|jgi:zinc/manganese transport system substrate-binding protein|uniref:Metal ABC transporter substrate-binding protein n=1 Tax=Methanospirillum hungatei TaxID=2203 RepID=A0A8F5VJN4_METHU|nr:metal ABC transporter substrate-binding protein [Methanospirillum hungatei]QXO94054.1 metal ABC transporter substrate-binding protein [Methanospirillum hungatei]
MKYSGLLLILGIIIALIPGAMALNVVTTTSVLWDPVQEIGGEDVNVVYIADPTVCPHLQGDILPGLIQKNAENLEKADLFLAHNASMDIATMQAIEKFRDSNGYGKTTWKVLKPDTVWNTPDTAVELADTVLGWLKAADTTKANAFEERAQAYKEKIMAAGNLTDEEKGLLAKKYAVAIAWQRDSVENWLGINVIDVFAPEFALGGNKTPAKIVDALKADPQKLYALDLLPGGGKIYVIENMQSGEMAKGIAEALEDMAIYSNRVIFTNFPKSVEGVNSIPDVLKYNKNLILQ